MKFNKILILINIFWVFKSNLEFSDKMKVRFSW